MPEEPLARHRIFLLSPANSSGERAKLLYAPRANFDLAARLRQQGVPLGEAFAFISGLYFRGKLAYAQRFAAPPEGIPGSFVVTSSYGLVPPETVVTAGQLQEIATVPIDPSDPRYRDPLERSCRILDEIAGPACDFILLGSIATLKYLQPMFCIFGHRLLFPVEFAGRGDMSRGRAAAAGGALGSAAHLRTFGQSAASRPASPEAAQAAPQELAVAPFPDACREPICNSFILHIEKNLDAILNVVVVLRRQLLPRRQRGYRNGPTLR